MTEVTVIIPTYNRSKRVCRAVSSVIDQTYKDFEIIVIDDASTDDTIEKLKDFGDRIKIIIHHENKGVSAARNSGIKKATGKFIALLDSDDYWMPEKLRIQISFFNENPEAVICQAREIWIKKGKRINPAKKHLKPSGDIFIPSLKLCLVSPSAVMFKKSLLNEISMFDEAFPVCEDYDLWLRIAYKYPVHLIEQDLLVKEGGAPDQLSSSMHGMDRFRIKAMVKIYKSGVLNVVQKQALLKELRKKCRVYGEGCIKRGKTEEGEYYLNLVKDLVNHEPH
jgi:glycosyltransferase involved in cell wall biosynthesis